MQRPSAVCLIRWILNPWAERPCESPVRRIRRLAGPGAACLIRGPRGPTGLSLRLCEVIRVSEGRSVGRRRDPPLFGEFRDHAVRDQMRHCLAVVVAVKGRVEGPRYQVLEERLPEVVWGDTRTLEGIDEALIEPAAGLAVMVEIAA